MQKVGSKELLGRFCSKPMQSHWPLHLGSPPPLHFIWDMELLTTPFLKFAAFILTAQDLDPGLATHVVYKSRI